MEVKMAFLKDIFYQKIKCMIVAFNVHFSGEI